MPTLVLTKVRNSVGLVIPEDLLLALNLEIGSKVDVTQVGNSLVVKPMNKLDNLHDLVKDMKKEQQHEETFADKPIGKEII